MRIKETSWMDDAKCKGMETCERNRIFFPEKGNAKEARIFCTGVDPYSEKPIGIPCPVMHLCLDYALSLPQGETIGIWAGTNANERNYIRYQREQQLV